MISGEGFTILHGGEVIATSEEIEKILGDYKPEIIVVNGKAEIRFRRNFTITFTFNGKVIYRDSLTNRD